MFSQTKSTTPSYVLFLLFGICTFFACQKDEDIPVTNTVFANVDANLVPYFERFEHEAANRGISIDIDALGIKGSISELHPGSVAGQCSYQSFAPNQLTIDAGFWNSASGIWKEFVIFHELGHCVLLRDHEERFHLDGTCVSIMRSGTGNCIDNYAPSTRSSYLDELFFDR